MLPNYLGAEWARQHFLEFNELNAVYMSYYGWRRSPYSGETIKIDDRGLRRTYRDQTVDARAHDRLLRRLDHLGHRRRRRPDHPLGIHQVEPGISSATISARPGTSPTRASTCSLSGISKAFGRTWSCSTMASNDVWTKCRCELGPYSHSRESKIRSTCRMRECRRPKRRATSSVLCLRLFSRSGTSSRRRCA